MTRFFVLSFITICCLRFTDYFCGRVVIEERQLCPVIEWRTVRPEILVIEPEEEQDKPAIHLYSTYGK